MLVQTTHQVRETGSKAQAGDSMRGIERIITPDDFTASVFSKMHAIAGDDVIPQSKSSGVMCVTPEEAIRELLEMQRVSAVLSPTASQ
jgi:hypothetical protein